MSPLLGVIQRLDPLTNHVQWEILQPSRAAQTKAGTGEAGMSSVQDENRHLPEQKI